MSDDQMLWQIESLCSVRSPCDRCSIMPMSPLRTCLVSSLVILFDRLVHQKGGKEGGKGASVLVLYRYRRLCCRFIHAYLTPP